MVIQCLSASSMPSDYYTCLDIRGEKKVKNSILGEKFFKKDFSKKLELEWEVRP